MKIKTWLLITYLLVMLLPLAAFYALYVSINNYYQDKNVAHYFETWSTVTNIKNSLTDVSLYQKDASYKAVEQATSDELMITLYTADGNLLYSSNPLSTFGNSEKPSTLFKNLYELQQTYRAFVYKEPVYDRNTIVGLYKITLPRTEWSQQVNNKTGIALVGLSIFLILLYGAVIYFLNRRLNKPMQQLIAKMRAFAKGKKTTPLTIKKDELGQLTASFQEMQQEIEEAREKIEQEQRQKEFMIASLSHDLKTPLTSIQAYAESLRAGKLSPEEQQDYLQVIEAKSDYMKQLLDDLMMFTLLQSPTYEMERVIVDGEEFFDMLLSDYEQISREKGFKATTTVYVTSAVRVNPKQLMRVVDNIVSNAWSYTNDGGTIQISAFEHDTAPHWFTLPTANDVVYIAVQNTGATLTEEQCAQMFEPLHQLDESRSQVGQRGAGLGLSIAKQIIDKHDGTIQAVSSNNQITILITLKKEFFT